MSSNSAHLQATKLFSQVGRCALVTGGGTGIGLMCAQALAANGARVWITGRRKEAIEQAAKIHGTAQALGNSEGKLIPLQMDITDKSSIKQALKELSAKEKALHILVNNAGISGPTQTVEHGDESVEKLAEELDQVSFDDWINVFKTNVFGHYFVTVAFLPLLAAGTASQKGFTSAVVNVTSISGMTIASQHHFPYNASKAAMIHLSQMLGNEFVSHNVKVRVNSLAPGIFPSEMTTGDSDENQKSHIDASGYREEKGIPAGRPGKDEDMAQALLALVSDQYIGSGISLRVDGGYLTSTLPSSA